MKSTSEAFTEALSIADRVVEGRLAPQDGALTIWAALAETREPYPEDLSIFIGLASEWQDSPQDRSALETDICSEARRLLASRRPGPSSLS